MTVINVEITVAPTNKLPHGTVRRAPHPSFAHAILLDQMGREQQWQIIDLYGPMEVETDADVAGWPIVYVPAADEVWQEIVPPIPLGEPNEDPPERVYPPSAFVIPCKNCKHNKWLHDSESGECHFTTCGCSSFEEGVFGGEQGA